MKNNKSKPNIIIMYADDLGYGDIGWYGGKISTPNLDRLASESLVFTDGYASAATCTPSRYSLLTGSYPWRNKKSHILAGDAPLIIEPDSLTLPGMLKKSGYTTGIVGKWHLGLGNGDIDWNKEIKPGPLELGFDYSFIMAATNDRVPCVYVKDRNVVGVEANDPIKVTYDRDKPFPGIPTGKDNPELLHMNYSYGHDMSIVNGISRIGYMCGGKKALWQDENMAEVFLDKAKSFVTKQKDKPFFLYYAFHQPHVPRVPGPRFAGKTNLGPRGDVIAEMDWCVGEMIDTLDKLGLRDKTMVIFTSDNGPVLDDGYEDQAEALIGEHTPSGLLRGGKYSLYDGGTRVPFFISYPKLIKPGQSSALVSQVDLFASLAAFLDQPLASDVAIDSVNILPAFLGESTTGREELVTEGNNGKIALRQGDWVFIPPYQGPAVKKTTGIELGNSSEVQLYNLNNDIEQQRNLAKEHDEIVKKMSIQLEEIRKRKNRE